MAPDYTTIGGYPNTDPYYISPEEEAAMNTERLQNKLDEADNEVADIEERARTMFEQITALIRAFADDHDCSGKSVNYAVEYTADALVDLIDDATGPAHRRKVRLENEIGDIEAADERRSAPMVL